MSTPTYDAIVLGTGGVGSAAVMHLAKRGARVLGIDQFDHGHDRGSSHGSSRVIRMAYFEHPNYVPLLKTAYTLWEELESATGAQLFHKVGLLEVGPENGIVIPGVKQAAAQHQLPLLELTPADVEERFPQFNIPNDSLCVLETNAGYLRVEDCVLAHLAQAKAAGADLKTGEQVTSITPLGDRGVKVTTSSAEYHAARLVITAGAWSSHTTFPVMSELNLGLKVLRKHLHWFPTTSSESPFLDPAAPTFFFELPDREFFYGFPPLDARGVKVAMHSGGETIASPSNLDRTVDVIERETACSRVSQLLCGLQPTPVEHSVCMYTMTDDENFVVDIHPEHPQISFAAGLSGHGFKFTTVLGRVLADLAIDGETDQPIGFLSCRRFLR